MKNTKIKIENIKYLNNQNNKCCLENGTIEIEGNKIINVGKSNTDFVADKVIDGKNKLAIPGLINCHTHSYMSVFRNIADDLSFNDWLFKNIIPREDKLSDNDAYWGAMLSCMEMIKTGTTCFLDMHMFKNMTAKAADECGMRAVMSRGLVGSDRNDEGGIRRINDTLEEMQTFKDNDRITFMFAPHAIYTCGEDYLHYVIEKAHEYNLPLHTHLSETAYEVSECQKEHNMSPVEYLDNMGFFDIKTVAAHCVHLSDNDIDILAKKNVSIAHNPKSNLKLGNGIAPIKKLIDKGANVCMGTDSQASNNCLNMFSEMNFASLIHKGANQDAEAVSAEQVLLMATVNGANALSLNDTGSIKSGNKADIVLLDTECPQLYPRNNLVSALCYSANGSEVDTVIIDGNIVLENKKFTLTDEEKVYFEINNIMNKIK